MVLQDLKDIRVLLVQYNEKLFYIFIKTGIFFRFSDVKSYIVFKPNIY